MNTYENMKKLIEIGKKDKGTLLTMMDVFLMNERITPEQYTELTEQLNKKYA